MSARPLTIMVGDSFTFGDEVSDHETVPAPLERLAGTQVLNGGVFGDGIDQTYLWALRLLRTSISSYATLRGSPGWSALAAVTRHRWGALCQQNRSSPADLAIPVG